ncbi:MAG: formate dehydrogenase accessory sulfurtransferase FdhD, partial [Bdellovibrionota bacterium]
MTYTHSSSPAPIHRVQHGASLPFDDELAVEEPLEIRLGYGLARTRKSISITMRTPGHDGELAAGFLFTEGLVKRPEDINAI